MDHLTNITAKGRARRATMGTLSLVVALVSVIWLWRQGSGPAMALIPGGFFLIAAVGLLQARERT